MDGANKIDLTPNGTDGIIKIIIKEGTGNIPKKGNTCSMHYKGSLENGKVFDQSEDPFEFKLGAGQVIKGWDVGVATMKVGEEAKLILKSDYAYGDRGYPGVIPGKATLIFEVKLLGFK